MKSDKAPKVTSIDSFSIKAEIKKCPIDVQQYISALERALERQKDVTNKAIKKIKELSKEAQEKVIDFDGNVLARVKIKNNKLEFTGAMNGYGHSIDVRNIKIKKII